MFAKLLTIAICTSIACLIVAMALDYSHNPLEVFRIAHIVILFGTIMAIPAMIYSYFQGSALWVAGVRKLGPYLKIALNAALVNGLALCLLTGAPFLQQDAGRVSFMFLAAFAAGEIMTASMVFCVMVVMEKLDQEKARLAAKN